MTVHELITQLQDCDRPDAEVRVALRRPDMPSKSSERIVDVYYDSLASNEVVIEGEVE